MARLEIRRPPSPCPAKSARQCFSHQAVREAIQVKALLDRNLAQFTQDGGLERYNQQPAGTAARRAN